jgi:osmoprotectant transport system permease protein
MRQAALALGLRPPERLRLIEVPLALPSILAGIKTSAVINVGTATIAAFIGAGGYGERIASGLALNDTTTLLAGAIPGRRARVDRAGAVRAWRTKVRLDGARACSAVIAAGKMLQCG